MRQTIHLIYQCKHCHLHYRLMSIPSDEINFIRACASHVEFKVDSDTFKIDRYRPIIHALRDGGYVNWLVGNRNQ